MHFYPVTTHELHHQAYALLLFFVSAFWYRECTATQFKTFAIASMFFLGHSVHHFMRDLLHLLTTGQYPQPYEDGSFIACFSSFCCMCGEVAIFVTWGLMVQNPVCVKPDSINIVTSPKKLVTHTEKPLSFEQTPRAENMLIRGS